MTLPEVYDLFDYWCRFPPEHEMLVMFAQAYTTWEPQNAPATQDEQRASLEARWAAGAMNVKQMFDAMGGVIPAGSGPGG